MIDRVFYVLIVFVFFIGCSDAPLVIEKQTLDQNAIAECKDKPCPQLIVEYIKYTGEDEVTTPINNNIDQYIIKSLYLGDPEVAPTALTTQEAMEQFVEDYWRDTSEFPDINEYEASIAVEETFRCAEFATIALHQYTYIGGAHGYGSIEYLNFNIETGEILKLDQIVKDKEGLAILAEQQLRKDFEISNNESLNAERFWFENDKFHFPDNIGFEKGKLIIHYNQYEIASYADGPIDIELSLEEAAPFLNYSLSEKE